MKLQLIHQQPYLLTLMIKTSCQMIGVSTVKQYASSHQVTNSTICRQSPSLPIKYLLSLENPNLWILLVVSTSLSLSLFFSLFLLLCHTVIFPFPSLLPVPLLFFLPVFPLSPSCSTAFPLSVHLFFLFHHFPSVCPSLSLQSV